MEESTDTMSGDLSASISALELSQSSILRMNTKKTKQLILEYKKEEYLWNTFMEDYPNRDHRIKAADRIAKTLNLPNFEGKHVMMKLKNLRNCYCQELKKIAQSLEDGSGTVYTPKVYWFPLMNSFIRPHLMAQWRSIIHKPPQPEEVSLDVKVEYYDDEDDDWADADPLNSIITEARSYPEQFPNEDFELSNDSRTKRPRLSNSSRPSEQNETQVSGEGCSRNAARIEDTYDSFGQYISTLLRSLPPEKALRLQPKIVKMIVDVGAEEDERL